MVHCREGFEQCTDDFNFNCDLNSDIDCLNSCYKSRFRPWPFSCDDDEMRCGSLSPHCLEFDDGNGCKFSWIPIPPADSRHDLKCHHTYGWTECYGHDVETDGDGNCCSFQGVDDGIPDIFNPPPCWKGREDGNWCTSVLHALEIPGCLLGTVSDKLQAAKEWLCRNGRCDVFLDLSLSFGWLHILLPGFGSPDFHFGLLFPGFSVPDFDFYPFDFSGFFGFFDLNLLGFTCLNDMDLAPPQNGWPNAQVLRDLFNCFSFLSLPDLKCPCSNAWPDSTCIEKEQKGKCKNKKVRWNCFKTCGKCS